MDETSRLNETPLDGRNVVRCTALTNWGGLWLLLLLLVADTEQRRRDGGRRGVRLILVEDEIKIKC